MEGREGKGERKSERQRECVKREKILSSFCHKAVTQNSNIR